MDKATLLGFDIVSGSQVVSALDSAGIKTKVALWMATPEYEDGRLVLASPDLDQEKPLHAYQQAAGVLQTTFAYRPPPILILPMKSPMIKELRSTFGKTASVEGLRLGGQTFGDRFISEAYVYRIK